MLKLKTFESFEPLYRQVSVSQAKNSFKSRGGYREDITMKEADTIINFIESIEGSLMHDVESELSFMHSDPPREVRITKSADEWFYIFDDFGAPLGTWYECDGFEGLMKCLEDL